MLCALCPELGTHGSHCAAAQLHALQKAVSCDAEHGCELGEQCDSSALEYPELSVTHVAVP